MGTQRQTQANERSRRLDWRDAREAREHREEMGNAQSGTGCFPSKKNMKESADVEYGDETVNEQPAAAEVDELSDLGEEVNGSAMATHATSNTSPAPPLVMANIKENKHQMQAPASNQVVRQEWYEFGVDEKVCEILRQSEMEHYIPNFAFHQIEFGTLPHLTVEDLKDMNVNRVGHRRKLLLKFSENRMLTSSRA